MTKLNTILFIIKCIFNLQIQKKLDLVRLKKLDLTCIVTGFMNLFQSRIHEDYEHLWYTVEPILLNFD